VVLDEGLLSFLLFDRVTVNETDTSHMKLSGAVVQDRRTTVRS
jgi:hypothetical protein